MALTTKQINAAFREIVNELQGQSPVAFTKPELKQAIADAESWAESAPVKSSFNSALTNGNFKSNATADQKRLVLIWALWAIIRG